MKNSWKRYVKTKKKMSGKGRNIVKKYESDIKTPWRCLKKKQSGSVLRKSCSENMQQHLWTAASVPRNIIVICTIPGLSWIQKFIPFIEQQQKFWFWWYQCKFSFLLTSGVFPEKLKIARLSSVSKNGKKDKLTNSRPTSVLPYISKISEMKVYNRLYA